MRIVVALDNSADARTWRDALSRELPAADVETWDEAHSDDASYAVGWAESPPEVFAQQKRLKAFFSIWSGVEQILSSGVVPTDLPLIRLEDSGMGARMVNYCLSQVLYWMRRGEQYAEQQRAGVWRKLPTDDMDTWPIGVFGLGVLGRQVAAAFASLGFPVNGYARSSYDIENIRCFAETGGAGDFAAFMHATRVLIILAPLTAATRDRFDRSALRLLQTGAYVINIARGGLLVDEALIELLDDGHLAGAALDVFREEPLPPTHPFWTHPRIRVTPHVSAPTAIGPAARQIAEKIRRMENNEAISGVVDRSRGY